MSLKLKFFGMMTVILALNALAYFYIGEKIHLHELHNQAQTVVANVEAFGSWVAKSGRVWVKTDNTDSYLSREEFHLGDGELDQRVVFFSKNPALAQREFADVVMQSTSPTKFRMTSDNVMNPNNAPDGFEMRALQSINKYHLTEFATVYEGAYRYAKPVYHTANCIKCHGDPGNAPEDVIKRYGTQHGFGFKEGDLAGVISVSIPTQPLWKNITQFIGPLELGLIASTLLMCLLCVHFWLSRPLARLNRSTQELSLGTGLFNNSTATTRTSRDEVQALNQSINRLSGAIQLALKKWRESQKPRSQ